MGVRLKSKEDMKVDLEKWKSRMRFLGLCSCEDSEGDVGGIKKELVCPVCAGRLVDETAQLFVFKRDYSVRPNPLTWRPGPETGVHETFRIMCSNGHVSVIYDGNFDSRSGMVEGVIVCPQEGCSWFGKIKLAGYTLY